QHPALVTTLLPDVRRKEGGHAAQRFQQGLSVTLRRHLDGFEVVPRLAAWKCSRELADLLMPACDARRHLLRLSLEAVRPGLPCHVGLMLLLVLGQRTLAVEALTGVGFLQARIHACAPVEHETLAIVVLSAALFEVLENAPIELKYMLEAFALHKRPGLLAPD